MVQITLTNQNPLFSEQIATIDILTGKYTLSDNLEEFDLGEIFNQSDFSHRLLLEPYNFSTDYLFHYEYSNIDELLYSAIYVYSILLNVDKPRLCQFKISPSAEFQPQIIKNDIYISIKSNKIADERISIIQIDHLISRLMKIQFHYSDDVLINDLFNIAQLPAVVNGDSFYLSDINIMPLLKSPTNAERFELRYIDPVVGFGLFTRSSIKKGEIIALYTGIKSVNKPRDLHFTFIPVLDSLNMFLDARSHGNITRFINHAPVDDTDTSAVISDYMNANLSTQSYYVNGIEFLGIFARRNILSGEQLFYDYGTDFFGDTDPLRFKSDGLPATKHKNIMGSLFQHRTQHLRIMAACGVKKARNYLLIRISAIVIITYTILLFIKY